MRSMLIAAALLLAATGVQAGNETAGPQGAPSVADMLQRKQEHQLRDQLAKEGRWDEIRKLDEESARRQQEERDKVYQKMNGQLSRSGNVEGPVSAIVNACEPDGLRMRKLKSQAADENASAAGGTTY